MKIMYTLLCCCFLTLFGITAINGQTTIDAEFRPRSEFREGFRKPLADTLNPAIITFQRTRLNVDYKGKILNARISLQDARIWGNSDNKTNTSKVEMNEAWFEYLITSGISIQMGRQILKYDDQRLFGASNWSNTGNSHDLFLAKYNSPFIQIHAGIAYNDSKDTLLDVTYAYTPKQNYKTMGFAWFSKQIYKGTTLSIIDITEGFQNKTNIKIVYPRFTYGANLVVANDSSAWGATLTAYLQQGKDPNKVLGKGYADLKSYFLSARASYKIMQPLTATLGIDYYSGSSATVSTAKSNTFNRLYGTTHSFNGSMEYFSTLPTQGLLDYYGGINTKLSPKLTLDITGHLFYFDKDFVYNKVNVEKSLGTEADITMSYAVSKEINIQGGYSKYFNSGSTAIYYKMQKVKTYTQQWAFIMLTIRPQFYKTPPMVESKS